jgi:hypothetical protein
MDHLYRVIHYQSQQDANDNHIGAVNMPEYKNLALSSRTTNAETRRHTVTKRELALLHYSEHSVISSRMGTKPQETSIPHVEQIPFPILWYSVPGSSLQDTAGTKQVSPEYHCIHIPMLADTNGTFILHTVVENKVIGTKK